MKKFFHLQKGFTLMEIMIVIAIIGILMTIGIFPYKDYLDRAELSNTIDNISQEWILTHKEIRNGLEQSGATDKKHLANILELKKGENKITKYNVEWDLIATETATGYTFSGETAISQVLNNLTSLNKKEIIFSKNIELKKLDDTNDEIFYIAIPPFAEGKFFTKNGTEIIMSQLEAKIGFSNINLPTDPNIKVPKIKTILFHPYLQ